MQLPGELSFILVPLADKSHRRAGCSRGNWDVSRKCPFRNKGHSRLSTLIRARARIDTNDAIPRRTSRRKFSRDAALLLSFMTVTGFSGGESAYSEESEEMEYRGPSSLGFSFMYPMSWSARKKPIRTHLYEINVVSPEDSSTMAGLVVDAVKIQSIEEFGTPQEVGGKVVAVELKKDSVRDADLVRCTMEDVGGLVNYVIEYRVDSTRGRKHFVAKATVTGGQLYVLTAQAKEDNFKKVENTLKRIVDTFEVQKQYT